MPNLVKIGPSMYKFSLFRNYLPLEKRVALHLNKLDFPPPKDALCQVWLVVEKVFKSRQCIVAISYLSPLGEERDP